jgi:hypothetical protein
VISWIRDGIGSQDRTMKIAGSLNPTSISWPNAHRADNGKKTIMK